MKPEHANNALRLQVKNSTATIRPKIKSPDLSETINVQIPGKRLTLCFKPGTSRQKIQERINGSAL